MQLGATIPVGDIGTGPSAIRDYAQAVEGLGYDYLQAPDHVLGANPATAAGKGRGGRTKTPTTTRSCCSASSPAARSALALPLAC